MRGLWWRRAALLVAGGALVTQWGMSKGRAELSRAAFESSEALFELAGAFGSGSQRVQLNGLHFDIDSRTLPLDSETVLDRLEARCRALDGGWGRRAQDLMTGASRGQTRAVKVSATSFRLDAEGTGMVACLELGQEDVSVAAVVARVQHMIEDGDLRHLAPIRLARVQPAGEGSHVVWLASRGPLRVGEAFPVAGDAPGRDPAESPRARGVRRLLAGTAVGRSQSIHVYQAAADSVFEASRWIREWRNAGWRMRRAGRVDAPGERVWTASRGTARRVVAVDGAPGAERWISVLTLVP